MIGSKIDSFVFFRSYYESIMRLDKDTDKIELLKCIGKYALDGELYESPIDYINSIFEANRVNIDYSIERRKQNITNGSKGGAPKGNHNASKQPKTTENNPESRQNNLNDNGNVYEDGKVDGNADDNLNVYVDNDGDEIPKKRTAYELSMKDLAVSDLTSLFPDEDPNFLDKYYTELKSNAYQSKTADIEVTTVNDMKCDIERSKRFGFYK